MGAGRVNKPDVDPFNSLYIDIADTNENNLRFGVASKDLQKQKEDRDIIQYTEKKINCREQGSYN